MNTDYIIKSVEELREVIEEPPEFIANKVVEKIDQDCRKFIESSPLVFMATSNKVNQFDVSPKGDAPGFVSVVDDTTVIIPDRPGNHLAFGFTNIIENNRVGLIFVIPGVKETLRINGSAHISRDPELLASHSANGKPAVLCTVVKVEECFFHCGKALIRAKLWQPEAWPANSGISMARQLATALKIDEGLIEATLQDDYANNLY